MFQRHLDLLLQRYPPLSACAPDLKTAYDMLATCYRRGGTVLICGNGGSAADAEHWAGELLKGFENRRAIPADKRRGMDPALAEKLQEALPTIPLTGFTSLRTAFANDVDPVLEFAQLVWGLGRPGDVLIGISTSGNAGNVRAAFDAARAKGLATLGLSGATGGLMLPLCDVCIRVPETRVYRIQEFHLPIYHCLSLALEEEFFGGTR